MEDIAERRAIAKILTKNIRTSHLIKSEWLTDERLIEIAIHWNEDNEGKSKIERINGHNADTMHRINFIQLSLHQWDINLSLMKSRNLQYID